MIKRRFSLTLFVLLSPLLYQCGDSFHCGGDASPFFDITALTAGNAAVEVEDAFYGIMRAEALPGDTIGVTSNAYAIWITASANYYGAVRPDWGGTIWACSPSEPGYEGSKERVKTLIVTSNADFDAAHPPDSNLNEFFNIVPESPTSYFKDSEEDLNTWLITSPMPAQQFLLRLKENVQPETLLHQFQIYYEHEDGEIFEFTLPYVHF